MSREAFEKWWKAAEMFTGAGLLTKTIAWEAWQAATAAAIPPGHVVVPANEAQDAKRYQWLRKTTNAFTNSSGERINVKLNPSEWDKAIDSAMLQAAKEKP